MKILIYGGYGWIGSQFIKILHKEFVLGKSRVDNIDDVKAEIDLINPTHVVSFIGRTHGTIGDKYYPTIDYLEQPGKLYENVRDNLFSPLELAIICQEKGIHFTYLGTGCIFEYDNEHTLEKGFTEESKPNFFGSSYSIVKGFTDRLMKSFKVLNLRIRMPINEEKIIRNFITKITSYEKVCSNPNSMTVLPELLPYVLKMMEQNVVGTINLTNTGYISHNEILELYREIVDPNFSWKNMSVAEQDNILACGRSNNYMETKRLTDLFPDVKNIRDAVIDCLKKYPKPELNIINEENTILLVTGGCGFIGSNFINYISTKLDKIRIINIDNLNYCSNINNVSKEMRESARYKFIKADLKNYDLIENIVFNEKPTHVVHFAAQSHVDNSFSDSLTYTNDNILGTHNLLEATRKQNIKLFVHVSTDEVYGESMLTDNMKNEHSVLCPTNPYAATKAGAELIAKSYYFSYKMPIIITRGNNVFGPNQYPEKLIPKFIKLLKEDKKLTIQGNGDNLRSFLYVDDVSDAFKIILERSKIGDIYNIGSDEGMEYSILDVAKILLNKIKPGEKLEDWMEYIPDRPFNDKRYYITNQKLKDLGWKINVKFEEGIEKLI